MFNFVRSTAFAVAVLAAALPVWADDNADANRLFVEAMQAWTQAEKIQDYSITQARQRFELLREVEANLKDIIDWHSGSDLAVQLLLGPVGPLDLEQLPSLVHAAEGQWLRLYVAEHAEEQAEQIELAKNQFLEGDINSARAALMSVVINSVWAHRTLSVTDGSSRADEVLGAVAEAQAAAGDVAGALLTVDWAILDGSWRFQSLRAVAEVQAAAGDVVGALETVSAIEDVDRRSLALGAVAEVQTAAGDVAGALETVSAIEDVDRRSLALRAVAEVQAAAGDVAGALETVLAVEDVDRRSRALGAVAEVRAAAGDVAGALETVSAITDVDRRYLALSEILKSSAALVP